MEHDHLVYDKEQVFPHGRGDAYFYSLSIKIESPPPVLRFVPLDWVMTKVITSKP